MNTLLLWIAVGIIVILIAVAIYYLVKLKRHQNKVNKALSEQQQAYSEKMAQIKRDIAFLARAYTDDQIELNEVSLRIHHLLNLLSLENAQREAFRPFDSVAKEINTIPTHGNWKALEKKERRSYEKLFLELESRYSGEAKVAASKISETTLNTLVH